jgi:hypothetical protein
MLLHLCECPQVCAEPASSQTWTSLVLYLAGTAAGNQLPLKPFATALYHKGWIYSVHVCLQVLDVGVFARTATMKDGGVAAVWDETLRLSVPADVAAQGAVLAIRVMDGDNPLGGDDVVGVARVPAPLWREGSQAEAGAGVGEGRWYGLEAKGGKGKPAGQIELAVHWEEAAVATLSPQVELMEDVGEGMLFLSVLVGTGLEALRPKQVRSGVGWIVATFELVWSHVSSDAEHAERSIIVVVPAACIPLLAESVSGGHSAPSWQAPT